MKISLYRYFDAQHRLLYVGISKNPINRLSQHGKEKNIEEIRYIELEWFWSRKEAELAEKTAVHRERPLWNVALQVAMRVPRVTTLPIANFSAETPSNQGIEETKRENDILNDGSFVPFKKGNRSEEPDYFGPPLPNYLWGVGVPEDDDLNGVLPLAFFELSASLKSITIRYGDVLIIGSDVELDDEVMSSLGFGTYPIRHDQPAAVESAKRLSRSLADRKRRGASR